MPGLGGFLISLLRKNKPIQNPENRMHQLLKFGVGGYLDYLEEFMHITISKIDIFNNNCAEDTTEMEEKISAGLLKLQGDELGIYRHEGESNVDYRKRLLSDMSGDNSILRIINIVVSLLNISSDSFYLSHEFLNNEPFCFGDTITNLYDNETTKPLFSLITSKEHNKSTIIIELPNGANVDVVYDVVSKMLFVGVNLVVKTVNLEDKLFSKCCNVFFKPNGDIYTTPNLELIFKPNGDIFTKCNSDYDFELIFKPNGDIFTKCEAK